MSDASSSVEKLCPFVADMYVEPEVLLSLQKVDDLLSQMVNIDGYVIETGISQFADNPF